MSELVLNAATMSCCGASRAKCRCRPTANGGDDGAAARSESGPGSAQHAASLDAAHATLRAIPSEGAAGRKEEHDNMNSVALGAHKYAGKGDSARAAKLHAKLAEAHESWQLHLAQSADPGERLKAKGHKLAASAHRRAADAHTATFAPQEGNDDQDGADDESTTQRTTNKESNTVKNRKNTTRNRTTLDTQMKTCPECGGDMMEGECEDCGWEGERTTTNQYGPAGIVLNQGSIDGIALLAAEMRNAQLNAIDVREDLLPVANAYGGNRLYGGGVVGGGIFGSIGNGGGIAYNGVDEDTLGTPTMNWGEVAPEQRRKVSGDTGSGRQMQGGEPSMEAQYDLIKRQFLTSEEMAAQALEDDERSRENRRRQGFQPGEDDLLPVRPELTTHAATDDDLLPDPPRSC